VALGRRRARRRAAAAAAGDVRVVLVPWVDDPYLELLERGLTGVLGPKGVGVTAVRRLSLGFALRTRRQDVVHLQWLDYVYRSGRPGALGGAIAMVKAARLLAILACLRLRGVRLVLTAHNIRPHDSPIPRVDCVVARAVARLVDVRVVHSDYARSVLAREFPARAPIVVMPFGAFTRRYPAATVDRAATRRRLGIPADARVALAFGQVRRYKRVDELIAAFGRLADDDAWLVVAGSANEPAYEERIRTAAASVARVVLLLERIPDEEVAELYGAADLAVIPYEEVFSSGALVLALSLGVPALVPDRGAALELAQAPVITSFAPGGLVDGLRAGLGVGGDLAEAAKGAVPDLDWHDAAWTLARDAYALPWAATG
jgi:beta-1,4-mannosyltransferase